MTGFASWLQDNIRPDPAEGITLDQALSAHGAKSWWDSDSETADPGDDEARRDDRDTGLLLQRYQPGVTLDLVQRLADTEAELADERAKLERKAKRDARDRRMLERGEIRGWDVALADDGEGDAARAAKLEQRAESLRRQVADAAGRITPQGPVIEEDAVESASRAAHKTFVETTRAMLAGTRPVPSEPRPFASRTSAGAGRSTEHTGADCWVCAEGRKREAAQAAQQPAWNPGQEATRGNRGTRYAGSPACSDCGYVYCQCGVAGACVPVRPGTPSGVYA